MRALLCDLDGVVRHWPALDDVERAHRLPVGTVLATAFADDLLPLAITGLITDEEWRAKVAKRLGDRTLVDAWTRQVPVVDQAVIALLRATGLPMALVTNGTTRLERDLAAQGLAGIADVVVNSARLGVAKPDPRLFEIAAERLAVPAEECLVVDDSATNVAAARNAGIPAHLYRSFGDLKAALSAR